MDVGLPEGQMGNSEVGHLNLGAGRIVYQDFTRINKAILDGELATNPVIREAFAICQRIPAPFYRAAFGWRRPQSPGPFDCLGQRSGQLRRKRHFDPRDHRRPRYLTDRRSRISVNRQRCGRRFRSNHCHGHWSILCHGSGQTLGAHQTGLGRHCARKRRNGRTAHRRTPSGSGIRKGRPTNSSSR